MEEITNANLNKTKTKTQDETKNTINNEDDVDEIKNSKPKSEKPYYEILATKSFDCLSRGIVSFSMVQDNVNLAFLYCNMGRYMRFKAHLFVTDGQYVLKNFPQKMGHNCK